MALNGLLHTDVSLRNYFFTRCPSFEIMLFYVFVFVLPAVSAEF